MYLPDNYSLWESHDRETARKEDKRPKCSICGEAIWGDFAVYLRKYGYICDDCLENAKESIDEF